MINRDEVIFEITVNKFSNELIIRWSMQTNNKNIFVLEEHKSSY